MNSPASVGGDERLRLFLALQLPDDVVPGVVAWQGRELRGGRIVTPENLHITLAFLGARPAGESDVPVVEVDGYRETRSVGMLTLRDEAGASVELAGRLHSALEELGVYRRESRPWLPHLTVLRFRERPRLRPALPDLGRIVTSDAAAYLSRLHPSGARYEVLETFGLGG